MRVAAIVASAIVLAASGRDGRQQGVPFVAIAVWYPVGPSARPLAPADPGSSASVRARRLADLRAIRAAGFNSIRTVVEWAAVESTRGEYGFEGLQDLLSAAGETGLKAIVQVDTAAAPRWLPGRYTDAAVINAPGTRATVSTAGYCQDHPGVRADIGRFIGAAATAAAAHDSFYAIDVWRNPGVSSSTPAHACFCAHTLARFRAALEQKYGTVASLNGAWGRTFTTWSAVDPPARPASRLEGTAGNETASEDWRQFTSWKIQQDLKFRADASAPRGPRPVSSHSDFPLRGDPWLMASTVDHHGLSMRWSDARGAQPFAAVSLLDLTRSAARDRSWWVGAVQARATEAGARRATGADLRLWSWAAISRGAGSISFDDWTSLNSAGGGLQGASMAVRAAGEFAGVVGRNSGLFSRLRPRPAKVAMLADPNVSGRREADGSVASGQSRAAYRALVDRNIAVDFVHPDEVIAGAAARYDVVYAARAATGPLSDALRGFTNAGGALLSAAPGELPKAPPRIRPEIGIDPAGGLVEARFLESSDALVLVALNYGRAPRTVTLTFAPDVPEAIWQNLETGAAVSFVQSPAGPIYTRAFAARDVLVLVRGKRLR